MKRKLWLLNLLLVGLVLISGWVLRARLRDARTREQRVLSQRPQAPPAPAIAPVPAVAPASPASYVDVAQKMLFAKDRNPNVVIEQKAPPPKPVMPPLPFVYGVMDFGNGPRVIMAEKSGAKQVGYFRGDKIGEFKLLDVNNTDILFEWNGERIIKHLSDLADKTVQATAVAEAANAKPAAAAAPAAPTVIAPVAAGPGTVEMAEGVKACVAGDNSPAGTVVNGMKKVVTQSPFGSQCRWEAVK